MRGGIGDMRGRRVDKAEGKKGGGKSRQARRVGVRVSHGARRCG